VTRRQPLVAKPLVFSFGGAEVPLAMNKVERADLYGYVEHETLDEKGRRCATATLASDGRTLVGPGGTSFAHLAPDGSWVEKAEMVPIDADGKRITPVASSFAAPVPLERTATVDEYLAHNVRSVYLMEGEPPAALVEELKKGTIFAFPYSFRGGLEPDAGFLLMGADGNVFMAVANPTRIEFVGFEQAAGVSEDDAPGEEESDEIDFSMM
jgi:hypothetical protein